MSEPLWDTVEVARLMAGMLRDNKLTVDPARVMTGTLAVPFIPKFTVPRSHHDSLDAKVIALDGQPVTLERLISVLTYGDYLRIGLDKDGNIELIEGEGYPSSYVGCGGCDG